MGGEVSTTILFAVAYLLPKQATEATGRDPRLRRRGSRHTRRRRRTFLSHLLLSDVFTRQAPRKGRVSPYLLSLLLWRKLAIACVSPVLCFLVGGLLLAAWRIKELRLDVVKRDSVRPLCRIRCRQVARADRQVAHRAADCHLLLIGVLRDHLLHVLLHLHLEPRPEALFVKDVLAGRFDHVRSFLLLVLGLAAEGGVLEGVLADCARGLLLEFQLVPAELERSADFLELLFFPKLPLERRVEVALVLVAVLVGRTPAARLHGAVHGHQEDEDAEQDYQAGEQGLQVDAASRALLPLPLLGHPHLVSCRLVAAVLLQGVLVFSEEAAATCNRREHTASPTTQEVEPIV